MADIVLNITGNASAAEGSIDSLVAKLQTLSNTLDQIGSKVRTAFGGLNHYKQTVYRLRNRYRISPLCGRCRKTL